MKPASQGSRAIDADVAEYLATGHADGDGRSLYPGNGIVEKETTRRRVLRDALIARVLELGQGREFPPTPADTGDSFLFDKLEPMVRGLFPKAEQGIVLDLVMGSVVFLDQGHALTAIKEASWSHTAWDIARMVVEVAEVADTTASTRRGGCINLWDRPLQSGPQPDAAAPLQEGRHVTDRHPSGTWLSVAAEAWAVAPRVGGVDVQPGTEPAARLRSTSASPGRGSDLRRTDASGWSRR